MKDCLRVWLMAAVCVVLSGAALASGDPPEPFERWYVVRLFGQPAGFMSNTRTIENDRVVTRSAIEMRVRRAEDTLRIEQGFTFAETLDGEPIEGELSVLFGADPMASRVTYTEEGPLVVSEQRGEKREQQYPPIEGEWLTPAETEAFVAQRMRAGAKRFEVRTIEPESGVRAVVYSYEVTGATTIEHRGRSMDALERKVRSEAAPGIVTTEVVDTRGVIIHAKTVMGGLDFEMRLATKAEALAAAQDGVSPELMRRLLVDPEGEIDRPRRVRRAVYTLRHTDGAGLEAVSTPVQHVERLADDAVRVTVDLDAPRASPPDDAELEVARASSTMIDAEDERVVALAQRGGDGRDPAAMAERLRRVVFAHMNRKDLSVGFASASEAAETRAGDCSEHAVLLAAVLRARGVPARIVIGLVYADQFVGVRDTFAYHMWTQAWLEGGDGLGRWVDLDPTLPASVPMDATHIALTVTTLEDGAPISDLTGVATLLGQLDVKIEEAR